MSHVNIKIADDFTYTGTAFDRRGVRKPVQFKLVGTSIVVNGERVGHVDRLPASPTSYYWYARLSLQAEDLRPHARLRAVCAADSVLHRVTQADTPQRAAALFVANTQ